MSISVFAVVMFAALLHAVWNAAVKQAADKSMATLMVALGAGVIAAVALPVVGLPRPESFAYLLASSLLQVVYYILVARAYGLIDMSLAYPLMRGSAPLGVALAGSAMLGENLTAVGWLGLLLVSGGIGTLALGARRGARPAGIAVAIGNAGIIAAYTLVDGLGARRSGNPIGYTLCLCILCGLLYWGWMLTARRRTLPPPARWPWKVAAIGGSGTLLSYGLALWAMTEAPVALVAALRETSILFGIAIAALVLGERPSLPQIAAATIIAAGVAVLRLAAS